MAHPVGAMDTASVVITNISDFIWGGLWNGQGVLPIPPLALTLLRAGLYMMVGVRFYPLRKLGSALTGVFRKQDVGGLRYRANLPPVWQPRMVSPCTAGSV